MLEDQAMAGQSKKLRKLLGPAGPEVTCEGCFERLDEYVEVELREDDAEARVPGMRAHFEGCRACREEYESLSAFLESA